jgi:hypothetical protein
MASLLAVVVPTLSGVVDCAPLGRGSLAMAQYLPDPGFGDPYAPTGYGDARNVGNIGGGVMTPNLPNHFGPGAPQAPAAVSRPAGWPGGASDPARGPQAVPTGTMPGPAGTPVDHRVARSLPPRGPLPPAAPKKSPAEPPYDPAEIIGHVGTEVIQASEVLLNVRMYIQAMTKEHAAELAQLTPEERAEQLKPLEKELVKRSLDEIVKVKLLVTELKQKIPAENLGKFETNVRGHFNSQEIKRLMDEHQATSIPDLENKLRALGTSLEAQRTVFVDRNLAGSWLSEHTKDDPAPPTHEQLLAYYKDHATEWDTPARVRWEQLTAKFDNFNSKPEAYKAIAQWGSDIWRGAPFAAVAKARSQDFAAEEGGVHDWASRGSLKSTVLDDALFTMPVGKLSVIIEDEDGFHIVRVLEREEPKHAAFTEVQLDIKSALKSTSKEKRQAEFIAKLRDRIPVWTILDDDFAARTSPGAPVHPAAAAATPNAQAAPLQR